MTTVERLIADGRLQRHVSLAPFTTYKRGGEAAYFIEAEGEDDVLAAGEIARAHGLPVLALGRGSNLVVASSGFAGLVIRSGKAMMSVDIAPDGTVTAGAACSLPILARTTVDAGRGGLEFFTGIPGSVGGAVRMNAGCHGSETADRLVAARIVDLGSGSVDDRPAAALDLAYRHSNLTADDFVVSATFTTEPVEVDEGKRRIREVTAWRRQHQPGGTLNAGSVFKNPPGDAAGRIIDELGLKGLTVGGASVSDRHANFIVAGDTATPEDVYALAHLVRQRVLEETGVELEPEIRFVGEFP